MSSLNDNTAMFDERGDGNLQDTVQQSPLAQWEVDDLNINTTEPPRRKHHIWAWLIGILIVLLVAAGGATYWFFQTRALPGTQLWGHDVTGKTEQEIANMIDTQVNDTKIPVSYDGKTAQITAHDLGISVDADAIAQQAVNAKRDDALWNQYAPWQHDNVTPKISIDNADPAVIDEHLGTNSEKPVNASLSVNSDSGEVEVVPAQDGSGADPTAAAQEAVTVIESLGTVKPQTVAVELKSIAPAVSDETAQSAKHTIDTIVANKTGISVDDHEIATFSAPMLVTASRIDPNTNSALGKNEARNGVVVFDGTVLQKLYEDEIKPTISTTKQDREVIVNGNDEETKVITEGHDGVKLADNADTNVGQDALAVLADGKGTVKLAGQVDPMKVKKTKRHIVVDLSDHKVYAYENDKLVKALNMAAGQGNDYETGKCNAAGDLCTPTGDFEIWLKYESQDMSGNLTLSDGKQESWDVKDVGFVNYFSKTGCAIHRIATKSSFTDAQIAQMHENTSHGCVGIGWDVAPWFYEFAGMGTTVHVQE